MEHNYLEHAGVKGMRWGIRRYQNKDGTLTPAGKKRYARELEKVKKEQKVLRNKQRTQAKIDKLEQMKKDVKDGNEALSPKKTKLKLPKTSKKKSVKDMTDEELKAVVDRLRLESDYQKYATPEKVSKGKKFADAMKNEIIGPAALDVGKQLAKSAMTAGINKGLGLDKHGNQEYKVFTNNKKKN